MSRMKIMLVSLLALLALGSVASATASAAVQGGPWWRHPETEGSQKQVKWPMNEEHAIKSENEGAFELKGTLLGLHVLIKCNKVTNKGNIWNGLRQGEDEAEVEFTECSLTEPTGCSTATVTVEPVKAYTELQWKYAGNVNELKEIGQQKIYDTFAPTEAPKEGKANFTNITITNTVCAGTFPVKAVGTVTTFTDQHQVSHSIVWGTAALVEPQNEDVTTNHLKWSDPNVKKLHHQEKETEAKLEFGGNPAELQGRIKVELTAGGKFGAYNE